MIVWGGSNASGNLNTGAFSDPPGWHTQKVLAASTPDDGSFEVTADLTTDLSIGAEYRIRITHLGNGASDDSDADFTIAEWPPSVTTPPADRSFAEGTAATLTVVATGNGPLYYQWERSDDAGATWDDVAGATSASYATPTLSESDEGAQFRCRVMSLDGMYPGGAYATSAPATLSLGPGVVSTVPANGAEDVMLASTIQVVFSRAMDEVATGAAFSVSGGVTGAIAWSADGKTLVFVPAALLGEDTTCTVTIGVGATDTGGVPLAAPYSFSFTTRATIGGFWGGGCAPGGGAVALAVAALAAGAMVRRRRASRKSENPSDGR